MGDPFVIAVAVGAAIVILLTLAGRARGSWRQRAYFAQRGRELRQRRALLEEHERDLERLCGRIIATSSTQAAPGFEVTRQIEAVFSDGHTTPARAVEMLKAVAAQKGANAILNLTTDRQLSGKCQARGDAVQVRPLQIAPPAAIEPSPDDVTEES